jgi:hypothetical protein
MLAELPLLILREQDPKSNFATSETQVRRKTCKNAATKNAIASLAWFSTYHGPLYRQLLDALPTLNLVNTFYAADPLLEGSLRQVSSFDEVFQLLANTSGPFSSLSYFITFLTQNYSCTSKNGLLQKLLKDIYNHTGITSQPHPTHPPKPCVRI